MSNKYVCKNSDEFAQMVINTAHRNPDMKLSELIITEEKNGGLNTYLNIDAYNNNRVYAVKPDQVIDEVLKSEPIISKG